jgi:hypothetical protein
MFSNLYSTSHNNFEFLFFILGVLCRVREIKSKQVMVNSPPSCLQKSKFHPSAS